MARDQFRLKIVRGELQFEAEGDRKFIEEMLSRFEAADGPSPPSKKRPSATVEPVPPQNASGKTLSVREFAQRLGFKKHTDLTLAFAYYLEHHGDKKEFTPADLNACYYDAKMETSNVSQSIIYNIKRGRMMEARQARGEDKASKKKSYTITRSGEEFVENAIKTSNA